MTTKVVNPLILLSFFVFALISITSCEKGIDSIGVGIIDNEKFQTDSFNASIIASNENVERVRSNNISQYLLGVYKDNEFGKLTASVVTQLSLPLAGEAYAAGYGDQVVIDSVLMNIPYQVTLDSQDTDAALRYSIDSVFGDRDVEFELSVYELKTFLNSLDPNDPTQTNIYYSDKVFQKGTDAFFKGAFKVNPNDTVTYIKRFNADGITVYDTDTIKDDDLKPFIKVPLDKNLIRPLLVDNAAESQFLSFEEFLRFFRGFYIQANSLENEYSHLMSLDLSDAYITIYFSNTQDEEEDEDLNGNGTNGETGVRVKKSYQFNFGNLKSNILERDYSIEKSSGENRIYVQGAAGGIGILDILSQEDLDELRSNNWLINSANLHLYVDNDASSSIVPEQLYLYNYDKNEQITDIFTEGIAEVGGLLERNEEGEPVRYTFRITDYISNLLISEDSAELVRLGLKVYNPTDNPTDPLDSAIKDFSWNPQGVVLFDQSESAGDKKLSLEIFYTEIK